MTSYHEEIEEMTRHAVFAGRATADERLRALKGSRINRCAVIDCPNGIGTWMTLELAEGRPVVLGLCEKDAALILLAEQGGRE